MAYLFPVALAEYCQLLTRYWSNINIDCMNVHLF